MEEITLGEALNIAIKKQNQGYLEEAETIYKNILRVYPNNSDTLHLLGLTLHQKNKNEEAIELIRKAIEINQNAIYHSNLGVIYNSIEKDEEASKHFIKALEIDENHENAYKTNYNLGVFYRDRGEIERALEYFNKSIELNENFAESHWNKSLILLLIGNFKEGFKEYEYRFKKKNPSDNRVFVKPKLENLEIKNKKILILSEQGFGDNIQFIRYLPKLKEKGAHIILECKKELKSLFENIPEIDKIIEKEETNKIDFDYYIHIMSLPNLFNTDLSNIPQNLILKVKPDLIEKFKDKTKSSKLKIGIAWAGNPNQENDKNRSAAFENFKCLKEIPGIQIYSLQKGDAAKQMNDEEIVDLSKETTNFEETAAIIENLDLIISVDTSIAHLAGALGKPVWTLLTSIPDWRWLLERKDCPWYPTMRLFRQKTKGDWNSLFEEVNEELKKLLKR